jgi:two-component system sensor histidine kinase RegB
MRAGLNTMSDLHSGQQLPAAPVRLRTLLLIRWIAAAGQLATVLIVHFGLSYPLPLTLCVITISVLAASNLAFATMRSSRARLADGEALALLGFDAVQLSCLLYLTGGLANPFSILILAPVLVSATILSRRATITLTGLALLSITVLAYAHLPLPWSPDIFSLPLPYVLGIWTALAVAAVFISTYVWSVAEEARRMSQALSETQGALARAQRLAALDGLAAAAAHELGTPLATISVVANELSREVAPESPIAEDVQLLLSQSERCRDILADIAAQPEDRGGMPFERLPLSVFLQDAVDDAAGGKVAIEIELADDSAGAEPLIDRRPEILRGLGNIIQNAEQFARRRVSLTASWSEDIVRIVIRDDGPGFPPSVLAVIGEPFISTRSGGGDHMGLGIFIAQSLLERSGAQMTFRNRGGGEVAISWSRAMLEMA